jgi:hypothetical protein
MAAPKSQINSPRPYQAALESLMGELEDAQNEARDKRIDLAIAEARILDLCETARRLVEMMPPHDRADLRHRIAAIVQPLGRLSRGATIAYSNILDLLMNEPGKDWSAPEVHNVLVAKGIPSDQEQVHNVLQYLARKQRIERVSRGRYRLNQRRVA